MKVNDEKNARIDKVQVYGFVVDDVNDVEMLIANGIITSNKGQKFYLRNLSGENYSSIFIKDAPLFDRFFWGVSKTGKAYGRLDISINDPEDANLNCYTASEYRDRITDIQEYLFAEYGIFVDFTAARYDYMEINRTVSLDNDFNSYVRPIDLIHANVPGKLRQKNINEKPHKYRDKKIGLKKCPHVWHSSSGIRGLDICIYNKTDQMQKQHKKDVDKVYLRYEIRLKSSKKIKDALETNNIWEVTDEAINAFWTTFIEANVIVQYHNEYCAKRDAAVTEILKSHYIPRSRTWIRDVLIEIRDAEIDKRLPLMLDIVELLPLLDRLDFPSRQIKHNAAKTFLKLSKNKYEIFIGDLAKYIEIMNKLA